MGAVTCLAAGNVSGGSAPFCPLCKLQQSTKKLWSVGVQQRTTEKMIPNIRLSHCVGVSHCNNPVLAKQQLNLITNFGQLTFSIR